MHLTHQSIRRSLSYCYSVSSAASMGKVVTKSGMFHDFFREINFTKNFVKLISRKKPPTLEISFAHSVVLMVAAWPGDLSLTLQCFI